MGPFLVVTTDNRANIDFMNADGEITPQHYAFLVSESDFDETFGRIRERALPNWADPAQTQRGEINHHDGGRGMYFEDPNGHLLEVITRLTAAAAGILDGRRRLFVDGHLARLRVGANHLQFVACAPFKDFVSAA